MTKPTFTKATDAALETKIKASLDAQALDNETAAQLKRLRAKALQAPKQSMLSKVLSDTLHWFKQPAGNVVLASLLVLTLLLPQSGFQPWSTSQPSHQTAVLDLIDVPDADALDETTDPDFYLWLAEVDGQNA